jgi:hypothetical protein
MLVLERCAAPALTVALEGARWHMAVEGFTRPSLALWYNRGGYPPGCEREEFGIEWMLTPQCLLEDAAAHGSAITLAPGESHRWAVIWSIEEHI